MTRGHLGFVFIVLYLGWVAYRLFIKRDIGQHRNEFYLYTFFVVAWLAIYSLIYSRQIMAIFHASN